MGRLEHFPQSHPYLSTTVRFVHFHDFQSRDRIDVRHVLALCRNSKYHLEETPPLKTNNSNSKAEQHNIHDSHTKKKNNHVRSNPPHYLPLPRAILPPDRPHPRQSTPDPWRASDNRCRWAGQRLLEPRKSDEPTKRMYSRMGP